MASQWNLWVWLECIGVVSGCCCKDRGIIIMQLSMLRPTPLYRGGGG